MSYDMISYHTKWSHVISCDVIPYDMIPHDMISYYSLVSNIISYHVVLGCTCILFGYLCCFTLRCLVVCYMILPHYRIIVDIVLPCHCFIDVHEDFKYPPGPPPPSLSSSQSICFRPMDHSILRCRPKLWSDFVVETQCVKRFCVQTNTPSD